MKKEVFIAIIIGFSLGLVITFGIYSAQQSLKNRDSKNLVQVVTPTPVVTASSQQVISISSPEDGSLVTDKNISVMGTTSPNSLIALIGSGSYTTTSSDSQGNFSGALDLNEGANIISVKAFLNNGTGTSKSFTVIYLPPVKASPSPSPTPIGTSVKKITPTP